MQKKNKLHFSQRHPLLFGLMLIIVAMVLFMGAMAFFSDSRGPGSFTFAKEKLGVVHVRGEIMDSRPVTDWIDTLERDSEIKGVLVRIDSPGGAVAPSQEIYQALRRLAASKPVIASMGSVAASGGYYVACGAPNIVANPGTLTASIGVKAQMADLQELMRKLGIKEQVIVSGKLKNAGSPFQPLSAEEKVYFQELVNDLHQQFVQDVAQARAMEMEAITPHADGRAMTGQQAYDAGLVDYLGGFTDALNLLKKESGVTKPVLLVEGPEVEKSLLSRIVGEIGFRIKEEIRGPRWEFLYE